MSETTSFDVEQHVLYRVRNAEVRSYPFPHFFISPVFPEDFYRELLEQLPGDERYVRLDETGTVPKGAYPERSVCALEDLEENESGSGGRFWTKLHLWMTGPEFEAALMERFRSPYVERFGPGANVRTETECRLIRDRTNYAISPHTDNPSKIFSLLFYLPADDSLRDLGTSIFVPVQPGLRCDGSRHHRFGDFRHVARAEFMPNSLFGFFKTDRAFHGVVPIARPNVVRNVLLYNTYAKKISRSGPRSRFRWPWMRD